MGYMEEKERLRVSADTSVSALTRGDTLTRQPSGRELSCAHRSEFARAYGPPCSPVVTPPSSYPVSLGDIPTSGTADAAFTINFTGCTPFARFTAQVPWSSAVYDTGTFASSPHSAMWPREQEQDKMER
jgi:hypothetical protein